MVIRTALILRGQEWEGEDAAAEIYVEGGNAGIVEMLLDRGADIGVVCNGVTALSLAAEKGQGKNAKLMLRSQERVREPP